MGRKQESYHGTFSFDCDTLMTFYLELNSQREVNPKVCVLSGEKIVFIYISEVTEVFLY